MRALLPFVAPDAGGRHRVDVSGELLLEAVGRSRGEPFECRTVLAADSGTASILTLRSASAEDVIDLDLQGTLQHDGVLIVTITLRIHHPATVDTDQVDAETTIVPAGTTPGFHLACFDADGCRVSARGSIAHGRHAVG